MSILMRVIVSILLVLSILALVLGIQIYNQRQEIKGRTQLLENGVIKIAGNLETIVSSNFTDKNLPTYALKVEDLKHYYKLDSMGKIVCEIDGTKVAKGSNTLDDILQQTIGFSAIQLSRLNDTRDELKRTQEELAKTQNDLRQMTTERDVATNRIAELTATLAERDRTIEEQKTKIAELTEEKDRLSQKIDEQTAQIGKLKDEKQDMETKMVADKRHIKELEKKIDEMMHPENMPKGIQGQVMVINSNYNFVVVDIPPGSRLYKGVELIVQREAIFVGKIRITDVKPDENFAVGDIMTDLLQVPVQVGDFIFN
jgi:DNA repair exonuclease SbcCD ATPase subunit